MLKVIIMIACCSLMLGCASIKTKTIYNSNYTSAQSSSQPIYLSFYQAQELPFYFLLRRDSTQQDRYVLAVRWSNTSGKMSSFRGMNTMLKFLVNNQKIYTLKPHKQPMIIDYNINNVTREEVVFWLPTEIFKEITYAKRVMVELSGKNMRSCAYFNERDTFRAFRDFFERSY